MEKFKPGQQVIYIPNHVAGEREHPDCEQGIVSTVETNEDGTQKVWVRYSTGTTGALTPTKNLVPA